MYNLKSYVRFCELNGLKEKFPTMTDEDAKKFCSSCTESMLAGLSNLGSLDAGINLLLIFEKVLYDKLELSKTFDEFYEFYTSEVNSVVDNITVDAGAQIEARCAVTLPNIDPNSIRAEVYYGKFLADGTVQDVKIIPMQIEKRDEENRKYYYVAKIDLTTGGNYGYSFRVMPEHEMILESANLDLVKWVEK